MADRKEESESKAQINDQSGSVGVIEGIKEGTAPETTDTNIRYAAYASRVRTILSATHRYVAYTSDIGESFRPIAHPKLVNFAYGISWAYLGVDVAYEGWKARLRQQGLYAPGLQPWHKLPEYTPEEKAANAFGQPDWRLMTFKRAVFQSIASMGLPAFTIHSTVRYSGRLLKNVKNNAIRTYTPIGLGLAVVPVLPYLFDEPVEHAVDYVFDKGEELFSGQSSSKPKPKLE